MPYTTQGYMTAADMADMRSLYDLDLCGCCENGEAPDADEDGNCTDCGCPEDDHN